MFQVKTVREPHGPVVDRKYASGQRRQHARATRRRDAAVRYRCGVCLCVCVFVCSYTRVCLCVCGEKRQAEKPFHHHFEHFSRCTTLNEIYLAQVVGVDTWARITTARVLARTTTSLARTGSTRCPISAPGTHSRSAGACVCVCV